MRSNKVNIGLLATLVLAAGTSAAIADEPAGADETVTVVVNMPNGRTIEVEEKAQPSRTTDRRPRAVRRELPDGSVISYGIGDNKSRRSGRKANRARGGNNARSNRNDGAERVSTLGQPRYDDSNATGGQDVRFFDAGISAMVIGRTVFIWGAELVQSDAPFEVAEGELFAFDGAVAHQERYMTDDVGGLTGGDSIFAPIKLEYEGDTQVTLTLHARADDPEEPDREVRTWTFRVR